MKQKRTTIGITKISVLCNSLKIYVIPISGRSSYCKWIVLCVLKYTSGQLRCRWSKHTRGPCVYIVKNSILDLNKSCACLSGILHCYRKHFRVSPLVMWAISWVDTVHIDDIIDVTIGKQKESDDMSESIRKAVPCG